MGQYYLTAFLNPDESNPEHRIRAWIQGTGMKLMEHAYRGNQTVLAVEHQLSPEGMFYKTPIVWAGDYSDPEVLAADPRNIYQFATSQLSKNLDQCAPDYHGPTTYRYIVNHSKKQFVDKGQDTPPQFTIHPLPLLTAEGNGRGGGDYRGTNEHLVGAWARDIISMEKTPPIRFDEFICEFQES